MTKPRILVVDDEPGMLRAVERSLSGNYSVTGYTDPIEARSALDRKAPPDIAIIDIRMPGIDGFELMNGLKDECPGTDVILMTGSMTEPDRHLTRAIREKAFYFLQKPFDRDVLRTLVQRCLELRRLAEENRGHLKRLSDELQEARNFQRGLLPPANAEEGPFSIASLYEPCAELGGDFFDFVFNPPGAITFLVADASGHGASAAMMNSVVKSALQFGTHARPLNVIRRISEGIESLGDDRFITAFCARIDLREGIIEYVNAGHPPALIRSENKSPRRLSKTGPLISPVLPDGPWECLKERCSRGDRLLLYTDGVSEVKGEKGLFGDKRIEGLFSTSRGGGRALIKEIMEDVNAFAGGRPITDDLTLMVVDVIR